MQRFKVKLKANEAFPYYMQHKMDDVKLEEWEKNRKFVMERDDINKDDFVRAEYHSYKNGKYYIPQEHIEACLIGAGKFVKAKVGNSTKTMTNIVAGMFFITSEEGKDQLPLTYDEYSIDKRSAVNKNVKARIIVIRPKFRNWSTIFRLSVDNDTLTQQTIKEILVAGGKYQGIGSFRPEHKGKFGRYEIESFEKI